MNSYFHRSGSSLVGSILSADFNSVYIFEPFHGKKFKYKNDTEVDLHHHIVDKNLISNRTNRLFNCMHVRKIHTYNVYLINR